MNDGDRARRVVLSYPDELGAWSRRQVENDRFRAYLKRVHDEAREGDAWEEFVDVGCCGDSPDIPLRVEAVDGGARIGPETRVEFVEREGHVRSGWEVQSAAGPATE